MISVVIPLYNKQESIVATLQSVLAQTYKDFEVVIVNDGSTDNSAQVVEEFISGVRDEKLEVKDNDDKVKGEDNGKAETSASTPYTLHSTPCIRLISQPNAGVSAARNTGILEAKGEYIAFLDGDDLWDEKYLETLYQLICDYPDASIYGLGCAQIKDGEELPPCSPKNKVRGYVEQVWSNYPGYWTGSSSSSKERLVEAGLFDTRLAYGEDIDMWWRLLLLGEGVIDNHILAYYRQDAENRAMNKLIPLEKHLPYYMNKYASAREKNAEFRRFFDKEMIYILYPYLFDKQYKKKAKEIAAQIDYSLQKRTMRFRMIYPYLYRFYQKLKSILA